MNKMSYLKLDYLSNTITRFTNLEIYLPDDNMSGEDFKTPYRTLYFLPGFSNNAVSTSTYLNLRQECELKGIAVVVINGDNSFYVDHPKRLAKYSAFINEVVEKTGSLLPLSKKRADTYIGGISMGGYGALYNGAIYNKLFSKVAVLSPSADCYDLIMNHPQMFDKELFENTFGSKQDYYSSDWDLNNIYRRLPREQVPKLLIACGEQDDLVGAGVERFREMLKKAGIPFVDYRGEGNHEFGYWSAQLDKLFSFLAGIKPGTKTKLVVNEGVK